MATTSPEGVPVTHTNDSTTIPRTTAEAIDEFGEPTLPPEAAPLLAAAGVQALTVKLLKPRVLGGVLASVLSVVLVSFARRALSERREA
jgi:hypothetical protein